MRHVGMVIPGSGYSHVVRGYIEPGDPTDQAMHIGDWVAVNTGTFNTTAVREDINAHVDLGRVLRLPVWDESMPLAGGGRYKMSGFALFRIVGYRFAADTWLLLELMGWDTSCGQLPVGLESVSLSGPDTGLVYMANAFTAEVTPPDATQPITYTWEATGQSPVTHTGGGSDTVSFTWTVTGTQTIMVTAMNAVGPSVSATHTFIVEPHRLYLPVVMAVEPE